MTFPTIDDLINKVWPRHDTRNVNIVLDDHERHYGLHLTHEDIEKELGR